jgi:lipoyl(octanoyl) transferase
VETWRLLSFQRLSGAENMAVDEAIFRETATRGGEPTLRLYGWIRPTVTVGYSQDLEEDVNRAFCEERGIDIVRRPTGGKAVYHSTDLTYSLASSQHRFPFSADILGTYRVIGRCLIKGLGKAGISAELVEEGRAPGRCFEEAGCFAVPFRNELLVKGAKICGSAQVRGRDCFLQHGSVLIDFDPVISLQIMGKDGRDEEEAVRRLAGAVTCVSRETSVPVTAERLVPYLGSGFEELLNIRLLKGDLTGRERALAERLITEKYGNRRWNERGRL